MPTEDDEAEEVEVAAPSAGEEAANTGAEVAAGSATEEEGANIGAEAAAGSAAEEAGSAAEEEGAAEGAGVVAAAILASADILAASMASRRRAIIWFASALT